MSIWLLERSGLIVSFLGSIILALSVSEKPLDKTSVKSVDKVADGKVSVLKDAIFDKNRFYWGVCLLAFGFFIQIVCYLDN